MPDLSYQDVLSFWFDEIDVSKWWIKDKAFDQEIESRFAGILERAVACELYDWRESSNGRLAEIIVLDQFSRNIFRDKAQAFMADPLALGLAQEAISLGLDKELESSKRNFLYMPFMHSESAAIHQVAVQLFESNDSPHTLEFELKHKEIIDQFGRYPHRNKILGRKSTPQEIEFLQQDGSSF